MDEVASIDDHRPPTRTTAHIIRNLRIRICRLARLRRGVDQYRQPLIKPKIPHLGTRITSNFRLPHHIRAQHHPVGQHPLLFKILLTVTIRRAGTEHK